MEQRTRMMRKAVSVKRPSTVQARVGLELVVEELVNPVFLTCAPGNKELYVVDQVGKVYKFDQQGKKELELVLDVSDRLVKLDPKYDERGLLGLAFHPAFRSDRRFFVFYSAPLRDGAPSGWNCTNHLVEYRMSAGDGGPVDPDSGRVLLSIDKPQMNHNGGHIAFGPDGYLYVPLGDGGGSDDKGEGHNPQIGNGQDTMTMLGKILRIGVDDRGDGREYGIPGDNPFVEGGGLPEIFAFGLRNPYHISFDAEGGHKLFAGDAGQVRWEEVDIIEKGGNYGWNIKEGRHLFGKEDDMSNFLATEPVPAELIDPIVDYPNRANRTGGMGSVVIGGYVYRGERIPFLRGRYIFGDLSGTAGKPDGRIFVASPPESEGGTWVMDELSVDNKKGKLGEYILSFGQDSDNELYVLSSDTEGPSGTSGRVYRIVPAR